MKTKILVVGGLVMAVVVSFWVYGNSLVAVGERESRWIVQDMWGSSFFGSRAEKLEEHERMNLISLREGSSENQELINYVLKNKCADYSVKCYLVMTAASNILIDAGEYDSGLRGMVEAINRVNAGDLCPIAHESAILRYKLKIASTKNVRSAQRLSVNVLERIKLNGGFIKNLKTGSCTSLAKEKPEFFYEYTMLIARIMELAGGDFVKAGAYISTLANDQG
ncbi:hypothetical protein [Stutzerimonas nitrititolerans]|uniref:Uncharacterized protein n=1 Tax=Stutzerimonas nitrititolerans TaxID=2482751 RepID=A0AA41WF05_9GAMM|nr:hypothetical protein [Stutzerimonas nitrititolerans]MCO7543257.1 hypothetical protein [Stutzerimonas nitrititolerans]